MPACAMQQPLAAARCLAYVWHVLRDYGHKRARNKRIGPGGGTRRLHQNLLIWQQWGRNRIDERLKGLCFVPVSYHRYRYKKASCK